ncbi:TetR/AcrR family transcriptional regulator [Nocardioides jiangxiensis]|uniref:TetR/AcrR family transcriptional regulator n=1 Tax=Nocardioides jiangxiensis TaxID=3064524 RepID=A0ABT9B263_9ACTN|nr:TetR/AcrR family transcriptional regulator [Nocardioides sp. WY-20]MDO7867258.1 TetR/AcrR family transcriptional regulator [Nocardioides sp. WY-20]
MSSTNDAPRSNRLEARKARTRAALIKAAQTLMADGRQNVPILEITQLADIGLGSFYNHFATREELYEAAVLEALDTHGAVLDALTSDIADPAAVFATSFRLTGRLHRIEPQLSGVVLAIGSDILRQNSGLLPRVRRDLERARDAGRFAIADLDVTVAVIAGAALTLGQLIHDDPERDDAETTDRMLLDLLRMLGVKARDADRLVALELPEFIVPALDASA